MIFVTVGTQLPFDRLVRTVDTWARAAGRQDVFAQVGPATLAPTWIEHVPFLDPAACAERTSDADLIVAHAGMGTILSALEQQTPIIVMPRCAQRGEHRNDHQRATVARLRDTEGLYVADDETVLADLLERSATLTAGTGISGAARSELLDVLRTFVIEDRRSGRAS